MVVRATAPLALFPPRAPPLRGRAAVCPRPRHRSSGGRGDAAVLRGAGRRLAREKGGRPWRRLPASGRRALLRFPAAGPRPRAGTGGGGEAWRGRGSGGVAGRPRRPPFPGGTRGAGGPVARACRRCRTRPRACPLPSAPGGGGKEEGTRASAWPLRAPFLPRRLGSTSRPAGTWPPEGDRARSTSRPAGTWPPEGDRARSTSRPAGTWPPEGGPARSTSRPAGTWPPEGDRARSTSRPAGTWPPEGGPLVKVFVLLWQNDSSPYTLESLITKS